LARIRRDGDGLAEVLVDDYRTLGRLLARPDFAEGVRAQLIDKDGRPKWSPVSLEALDPEEILAITETEPREGESALAL
jgi:enoyl-CoA hydratase